MKSAILAISALLAGATISNAAMFAVNNIGDLIHDTIYLDTTGNPLVGGVVTIGYFPVGVVIEDLPDLIDNLGSFLTLNSAISGETEHLYGVDIAGFAENLDYADIGRVTVGNPLLGRSVYSIVGDSRTLEGSTSFLVVDLGPIRDEPFITYEYRSNPMEGTVVVGYESTWTGDLGVGYGELTYNGVAIPEPATALLGAFGVLGLLRRRR